MTNLRSPSKATIVQLPDEATISSSHEADLPIYALSNAAKKVRIFPDLSSSSLLSIGQLCDDNCIALFHKDILQIIKNNKVILEGLRNRTDGLWDVPLPVLSPPMESANAIIRKNKSKRQLAEYYHACAFSPVLRTFAEAINNGNFHSWPGLQELALHKHLKRTEAVSMGHLDQEQQGLQSTKVLKEILSAPLDENVQLDYFQKEPNVKKTNDCLAKVVPFTEKQKGYMDLTGRFPYKSSRGHEYVLIVYDYDSNAILAEPLVSRLGSEIARGWKTIHQRLSHRGVEPNLYVLDNECSEILKQSMTKEEVQWQRATPYMHRTNAAERAICTFKNHFVAGLATIHPEYPITEWDRLVPQAEMTLNMLRNSRVNPKLSSYAYLFGPYDFNAHPMAPPGTLVALHVKPDKRASWAPHSRRAFYIGPALEHYRNFKCYLPDTRKEVTSDTVDLFAHVKEIPEITHDEYIQQSLMDILAVLQSKFKSNVPSLHYGEKINDAIISISNLLGKAVPKPTLQPISQPTSIDPPGTKLYHTSKLPRVKADISKSSKSARVKPMKEGTNFKNLASTYLAAQSYFQHFSNHIFDAHGKRETIDSLLQKDPSKWNRALSNEWGRLAQGNDTGVIGTDTIQFIFKHEVPDGRDVTYATFVCDYRPLKSEPFRVRIVVGGDKLSYADDAASPATDLLETKILLNSTISDADKGARFLSTDLKDFFLALPMAVAEFMRVPINKFPKDIIEKYDLMSKVHNGYVYIRINKGMYGLKQAAILAYVQLKDFLEQYGYYPEPHCVGLWSHRTRKTKFCLCVDDFGVKYFSDDDANHLLNSLKRHYQISTDWKGQNYCGLTLEWDYNKGYVDISMPEYVRKQLERYGRPKPPKPQFAPHKWSLPSYGVTPQTVQQDNTTPLDKQGKKYVQSVSGAFLYYGRSVDPTILPALTDIASAQANPTEHTLKACHMLMDYLHTYPNAKIRYSKSDMVLYVDSDAAYLVLPKARSRIAGHFYLGTNPPPPPAIPNLTSSNGPILTVCKRLRNVVSSAAEAETGAAFHNSKEAIPVI